MPEEKYSIKYSERPERFAGQDSKARFISILRNGKIVAQIKYEMVGKTVKSWNRIVAPGGTMEERREANALFAKHPKNKDGRTLGEELLIQAVTREKAMGITSPHNTASSNKAMVRTGKKFGLRWNHEVPEGLKTVLPRRRK
jgi:hypothetical protein